MMPLNTYRYAVCGGGYLFLDALLYFILYNFVFAKENVDLGIYVLSPHIAALVFVFPITLTTGFLLNRYVAFDNSKLSLKVQLFRYLLVGLGALLISYLMMKFLVDGLAFYPTPSRLITIVVSVIYSYILQSKFSFKTP